jgi:hypothetical protein
MSASDIPPAFSAAIVAADNEVVCEAPGGGGACAGGDGITADPDCVPGIP